MGNSKMTKAEREELARLLKARARVANRVAEQRAAELFADVERQLATRYEADAAAWKDVTSAAKKFVEEADAELARRCRARDIPEQLRPRLVYGWLMRGENAFKDRRAELRKVAQTRIEALAAMARATIETKALDGLTMLVAGALETAEAREFLKSMPTIETLMPAVDVSALDPLALPERPEGDIPVETN